MDYWSKYGAPLYRPLTFARFFEEAEPSRLAFDLLFAEAVATIPTGVLGEWLRVSRLSRLVAPWIIGARREGEVREEVTRLLLEGNAGFSEQGLCVAMARYGDLLAAESLVLYLDTFFPVRDGLNCLEWAVGALVWLDSVHGTTHARRFLDDRDAWQRGGEGVYRRTLSPQQGIDLVAQSMAFLDGVV